MMRRTSLAICVLASFALAGCATSSDDALPPFSDTASERPDLVGPDAIDPFDPEVLAVLDALDEEFPEEGEDPRIARARETAAVEAQLALDEAIGGGTSVRERIARARREAATDTRAQDAVPDRRPGVAPPSDDIFNPAPVGAGRAGTRADEPAPAINAIREDARRAPAPAPAPAPAQEQRAAATDTAPPQPEAPVAHPLRREEIMTTPLPVMRPDLTVAELNRRELFRARVQREFNRRNVPIESFDEAPKAQMAQTNARQVQPSRLAPAQPARDIRPDAVAPDRAPAPEPTPTPQPAPEPTPTPEPMASGDPATQRLIDDLRSRPGTGDARPADRAPAYEPPPPPRRVRPETRLVDDERIYRLGPNDVINVTVFGEENLSGEFTVDSQGQVALPLIGALPAAGRTLREFEQDVSQALNYYLINPRVSLGLTKTRPFYIHGEVEEAGEYEFVPGMHVLTAIGMAGGYTPRANENRVYVVRRGVSGRQEFPATAETKLQPGDVVIIPERIF